MAFSDYEFLILNNDLKILYTKIIRK